MVINYDYLDSLLSCRICVYPQIYRDRVYFISDISGRFSLYSMPLGGGYPAPMIPVGIALQNPKLMDEGRPYQIVPAIEKIVIMIDSNGDEAYQPFLVPWYGGIPEPLLGDRFIGQTLYLARLCRESEFLYFQLDPKIDEPLQALRVNVRTRQVEYLGSSRYGNFPVAHSADHSLVLLQDFINFDDIIWYRWNSLKQQREIFYGVAFDDRWSDYRHLYLHDPHILDASHQIFYISSEFEDGYGPCLMDIASKHSEPINVIGIAHCGQGELASIRRIAADEYVLEYNIDGCSFHYLGELHCDSRTFHVRNCLCGSPPLANGVANSYDLVKTKDDYLGVFSFSRANLPTQLYRWQQRQTAQVEKITDERLIGTDQDLLATGEDASYFSHDGLRISARLYMPSPQLDYQGPYPLILYIHGGPQSQERPDFSWFSIPLIQYFTLNGFAVFVPNVRGSTGYGASYMNHVAKNWGGEDRLDHVHALNLLRQDRRIAADKVGVMGRSYGGYMTLTLLARHPEFFAAGCDMFGPYDLIGFYHRAPKSHLPFLDNLLGNPNIDKEMLIERSPCTYLENISCPLLVIQGENDPRVLEAESAELVAALRRQDKQVEYLKFADEGHDVIKYANKMRCYKTIADFFKKHLLACRC